MTKTRIQINIPLEKIDLSKLAPEAASVIRALQETRKQLLGTEGAGQPGSP